MSYRMISQHLMLLLVFYWAPKLADAQERKIVAVGSSVLLTALPTNTTEHIQWEYIRTSTPENIVHYYRTGKEPVIAERYEGRVVFYSSNGSLLLKNVQETDSGTYRATINLNKIEAKQTALQVIEPVSKPQLQINSTVVGSAVELSCKVPAGKVQAIDWKKDGKPLPRSRCYQLSESFNVLYIPEGQKSDCGSFSCNASNEISWQETSVNLTIEGRTFSADFLECSSEIILAAKRAWNVCADSGNFATIREGIPLNGQGTFTLKMQVSSITSPQKHALTISTVALAIAITLAGGSVFGFLVLCCQTERKKITGELWRWLVLLIHGLVCISSTLMIIASVLWMREDGLSTSLILYMILLTWVTIVTLLISMILTVCPRHLEMFKKKTIYRIFLDTAAPGGVILVVLCAIFLAQNIHLLQKRACRHSPQISQSQITELIHYDGASSDISHILGPKADPTPRKHITKQPDREETPEKGCSSYFESVEVSVISAAISLLILLVLFLWYHRKKEKSQPENESYQQAEGDLEEEQQL